MPKPYSIDNSMTKMFEKVKKNCVICVSLTDFPGLLSVLGSICSITWNPTMGTVYLHHKYLGLAHRRSYFTSKNVTPATVDARGRILILK
jgi:hypothetical protein